MVDAEAGAVDFVHGKDGLLMAPAFAVPRLLARHGMTLGDFEIVEIHEAFASTVLATLKAWEDEEFCRDRLGLDGAFGSIDRDRLNVHGSSLAAGHPFAATGGRIVATAAKELSRRGSGARALVSVCAAGGPGRRRDLGGGVSDTYLELVNSGFTAQLAKRLGLPRPARLRRFSPGDPLVPGPVLVLADRGAGAGDADALSHALLGWGLDVRRQADPEQRWGAVVLVLTGVAAPDDLTAPAIEAGSVLRRLASGGRVVTVSRHAEAGLAPEVAAARQGVDGFLRSLAKELRGGATGNGVVLGAGVGVDAPSVLGGAAVLPLGQVGVRRRPAAHGRPGPGRARPDADARSRARWPWSPARPAGSAHRSRGHCPRRRLARRWSTCRRPATAWPPSRTPRTARRSSWT